jgi:hypothetical protein
MTCLKKVIKSNRLSLNTVWFWIVIFLIFLLNRYWPGYIFDWFLVTNRNAWLCNPLTCSCREPDRKHMLGSSAQLDRLVNKWHYIAGSDRFCLISIDRSDASWIKSCLMLQQDQEYNIYKIDTLYNYYSQAVRFFIAIH